MILKVLITIVMAALTLGCGHDMDRVNLQARAALSLSEQFETVVYSKPEFASSWDTNNPLPKGPAGVLRDPFEYLWMGLDSLPTPASPDLLANSDAVLMGAKEFRPPAGLGLVRSQRCYVVVLKSGSSFDLQKYAHGPAMTSTTGMQIWNWSAMLGEFGDRDRRPSALHATKIEQLYLLVSNDVKVLETLAKRLTSSNGSSHDSVGFHDWAQLSQHEMWGYRRYHPNDADNKMAAGIEDVPPSAEALVFFLDGKKKTVVLRLVLKESTAESAVAKLYSRYKLPLPTQSGGGAWEAAIPLSDDQKSFERSANIVGLFGFGVYS